MTALLFLVLAGCRSNEDQDEGMQLLAEEDSTIHLSDTSMALTANN